ncbi:MAG TPA: UDP-glucose 4-epimerase GalE [Dyella sp.]|uniref:UDP-glucose 4-epimerase GalE n=1 Tax=Dyella sp. TaxID=1869338 RepID=UPI002CFE0C35|nr:UDP-glucose 4-epimerase GalE [Dyella sp.]HUB91676.1 UDP-glucose 4-epimerase GalE [Dyella sp.]
MTSVLICGGAGYIGAHMLKMLALQGYDVVVFDNLSTGHRAAVRWGKLVEGDILDPSALERLFATNRFDVVIHFCALSLVGESVRDPYNYYRNNVAGTLNLLEAMRRARVGKLVFSSTASVYGIPRDDGRLDELHPTIPINPYGVSKLMVERVLQDAAHAYGLRSVALRYFNAAGADPEGDIGESHVPETHLIPNVLRAALGVGDGALQVFGDDYDTRDGTCVRDYVHVNDLASAHLHAIHFLEKNPGAHCFNLGSGKGATVLEIIAATREVTGRTIPFTRMPRREGDPAMLVADTRRAEAGLGWQPVFSDIRDIIETAWRWHCSPHY